MKYKCRKELSTEYKKSLATIDRYIKAMSESGGYSSKEILRDVGLILVDEEAWIDFLSVKGRLKLGIKVPVRGK